MQILMPTDPPESGCLFARRVAAAHAWLLSAYLRTLPGSCTEKAACLHRLAETLRLETPNGAAVLRLSAPPAAASDAPPREPAAPSAAPPRKPAP